MINRAYSQTHRITTVCVDENEQGIPRGRIYNDLLGEGCSFSCLTEFLQKMEVVLSKVDCPKSFTEHRTFAQSPTEPQVVLTDEPKTGRKATFAVRILFRQNATWQGSVTWLEGRQEQSFRSALELIFLMSSALNVAAAS